MRSKNKPPAAAPEIKKPPKSYLDGTPGAVRLQSGVTLTALRKQIDTPGMRFVTLLNEHGAIVPDADGNPQQTVEPFRDTGACTKRRRYYERRGLLDMSPRNKIAHEKRLAKASAGELVQ